MKYRKYKIGRDAINGQFLSVKVAKGRPKTSTIETMKIKIRK